MNKLAAALLIGTGLSAVSATAETTTLYSDGLFPEGALIVDGQSYFVELTGDRFARLNGSEVETVWPGNGCFPASAIDFASGFLVACNGSSAVVQLDGDGNEVSRSNGDVNGVLYNQPNDFIDDGNGGVWFTASGAPDPSVQPQGQVFHMTADGQSTLVADGLSYANGLAVTTDNSTLLVADMFNSRILSYPIDGTTLGEPTVWSDLSMVSPNTDGQTPTFPDGMEIGPDGLLYVAIWAGSRIIALDKAGQLAKTIETPLIGTTNLTFASDGSLFVTGVSDIVGPPFPGAVLQMDNP